MKNLLFLISIFLFIQQLKCQSCAYGNVCGDGYCCKYSSGCECSHVVCREMCFHGDSMPNEINTVAKSGVYTNRQFGQPIISTDGGVEDLNDLLASDEKQPPKKKPEAEEEEEESDDVPLGGGKAGGGGKRHHKKRKRQVSFKKSKSQKKHKKASKKLQFLIKTISKSKNKSSKALSMKEGKNKGKVNNALKGVDVKVLLMIR